ncbi:hypothetical protein Glove_113g18 [Diversispora epigaea]|uniref:Uncharacterized protein n=1 Tax=Diversispora epigaea TaxID=1348612 RepID=A0A397J1U9_9GLOM|nr:hypothetical protein Glove_113g18 [Diversispora epigaea]
MVRKDKKSTICVCCNRGLSTPQKLRQHYASSKNQCTQLSAFIQVSINVSETVPLQIPEITLNINIPFSDQKLEWEYQNTMILFRNRKRGFRKGQLSSRWDVVIYKVIQDLQLYLGNGKTRKDVVNYIRKNLTLSFPKIITQAKADSEQNSSNNDTAFSKILPKTPSQVLKNANDRLPGETIRKWGSKLRKRIMYLSDKDCGQPKNLAECKDLYDELLQIDGEAYNNIKPTKQTKEEQEFFRELENEESNRQVIIKSTKNQETRKPVQLHESLIMITGDHEKSIIFREQILGRALKRRAVAVHNAKVPKYHSDNGSDIRKMLESQRKPFQELLEKEFDKRGQFKFSLCSLTKFLVDNKPGDKEKDNKKNTRIDWLRNKQIIVYNRSEIDNYLSNAFEQIINQVEGRGGKSNA